MIIGAPLILIVDDATDVLEAWQVLLQEAGYIVITAINGSDGLSKAQQFRPRLIVTDLMMPVADGLTLCRRLKADPVLKAIPVILWTAAIVTIAEPVFDRFLTKPVFLEELLTELKALLR